MKRILATLLFVSLLHQSLCADDTLPWVKRDFNNKRGHFCLIEASIPTLEMHAVETGVDAIYGYRFSNYFAFGPGLGLKYDVLGKTFQMPIFIHLRSDLIDGSISPYVATDIGYNMQFVEDVDRGLFLKPSVGVGFNVGKYRVIAGVDAKFIYGRSRLFRPDKGEGYNHMWYSFLFGVNLGFEF